MNEFIENSMFYGVLAQARATGHLGSARLLSPADTANALKNRKGPEAGLSGWYLCGETHPEMWSLMNTHPQELTTSANFIDTPDGASFFVTFQRIRHWIHCFSVPLVGKSVADFTNTLAAGKKLQLSLAKGSEENTLVMTLDFPRQLVQQICESCQTDIRDVGELIEQMSRVTAGLTLRQLGSQKSEVEAVTEVCVSPLIPDEVLDAVELALGPGVAMSVH